MLDNHIIKNTTFKEDFIIVVLSFTFVNFIMSSVLSELIWPTHFFNRRHSTGFNVTRYRVFADVIGKVIKNATLYKKLYKTFYKTYCSDHIIK
jgi:hypothetical protein